MNTDRPCRWAPRYNLKAMLLVCRMQLGYGLMNKNHVNCIQHRASNMTLEEGYGVLDVSFGIVLDCALLEYSCLTQEVMCRMMRVLLDQHVEGEKFESSKITLPIFKGGDLLE